MVVLNLEVDACDMDGYKQKNSVSRVKQNAKKDKNKMIQLKPVSFYSYPFADKS